MAGCKIKKIMILIIMTVILTQTYGLKISSWKSKNKKGQEVITEKYRNEPDGMVKLIIKKENGKIIDRTYYYKGNAEHKEKEIEIIENGYYIKLIHTYYYKDNPEYWDYALSEYTSEGTIITTHYLKNPKDYLTYKQIKDKSGNKYKDELIYDRTEGWIKEDLYYENNKVVRIENFYKNDKSFRIKSITFFKNFKNIEDNVKEKEEQYFENDPKTLEKIIIYYDDQGGKKLQEQYYINHPKGAKKIIFEFINGKMTKATAYDKDGNVLPDN